MTTHRERALGQARADLVALPDLVAELARLVADRHHDTTGYRGKVIGSPAPLQIPVVHLVDVRHKPRWHGEDPRHAPIADRYGIAPALETWVRVLAEELPEWPDLTERATVRSECATLVEHWAWITEQEWATELAQDVTTMASQVRAALGVPKEQRYACPECGNPAYLVPGGILSCQEGHERVVRDLERQQRRRPAITTKDAVAEFGLSEPQLWQWKHRRKIVPSKDERGRLWWWPWDIFCLLNPDIAEAIRLRDEMAEDDQEETRSVVP